MMHFSRVSPTDARAQRASTVRQGMGRVEHAIYDHVEEDDLRETLRNIEKQNTPYCLQAAESPP